VEDQAAFVSHLARKLGIKEDDRDGWYKISTRAFVAAGGGGLLRKYDGSLSRLLGSVYPDHHWKLENFNKRPQNFWGSATNQRAFLDQLGRTLGFKEGDLDAWYGVSYRTIAENHGSGILRHFGDSIPKMLSAVYTERPWDPLKFSRAPVNHWSSTMNQRAFMDRVARSIGFDPTSLVNWYSLSVQTVVDHGGSAVLKRHENSLAALLAAVYPEFPWDPLRFEKSPHNYWTSLANQRSFVLNLAVQLELKPGDMADFYKLSRRAFLENGGSGLLKRYGGSVPKLLASVFPEVDWQPWRFPRKASAALNDLDGLLPQIEVALGISSSQQWLRVSKEQLDSLGLAVLSKSKKREFVLALKRRYPEEEWQSLFS